MVDPFIFNELGTSLISKKYSIGLFIEEFPQKNLVSFVRLDCLGSYDTVTPNF